MTSKNMGICPVEMSGRRVTIGLLLTIALLFLTTAILPGQDLATAEAATQGLSRQEGFVDVFWNDADGKVLIEFDDGAGPFLYHTALAGGLGSNDVGLDRGLLGATKLVRFRRIGKRVLMFEENTRYRATSDNEYERVAVEDAFARSVVHGFDLVGRTGSRLVIDATSFIVRDAMGIARQLKQSGQGDFALDSGRSAVNPDVIRAFPHNAELEAWLTFTSSDPGGYVAQVATDPYAVTLRLRHSLIALPDEGYAPRRFDPRAGYYGITFVDYSTSISAEKEQRFIARHRLRLEQDRVVEPIIFYLDRGVPEPIRSALLDGARWWTEAFEAAGLPDAYQVEMLPEGADALDIRYNVIQWVHRATRGWSWGDTVVDPRTGEILKGYVALGSLRVRQDYLLAQSLLGSTAPDPNDPTLEPALARIRQLAAHEVGHALGLVHNFAASVSDRASVMDYPAPLVRLDQSGSFSHDNAYTVGIGEWDKYAIRYGYTPFPMAVDEEEGLTRIVRDRREAGLQFISDTDARPVGGAHPEAHLWDNGPDILEALEGEMALRRVGLEQFGPERLQDGRPLATLEDVLVPLYLRHRYQLEAAAKLVGGVWYEYELVGEPSTPVRSVDGDTQRRAVRGLLGALAPAELRIPERVRRVLPPRPLGYPPTRELFQGDTGLTFDAFAPAEAVAHFVFGLLVDPERATRLAYQKVDDPSLPGLDEVLREVRDSVFAGGGTGDSAYDGSIRRIVQDAWTNALIELAGKDLSVDAAAILDAELTSLSGQLSEGSTAKPIVLAHRSRLAARIDRFLLRSFEDRSEPDAADLPP
ncbi:MAG TPA: zinc-dependent metalloprotease, partial [Rhodothermales bacterium]